MEKKIGKKIVCIGDINPDLIIPYGEMKQFMRTISEGTAGADDSGPMVTMRSGGGMGSTVVGLGKLGLSPMIIGKVGRDSISQFVVDDLLKNKVDVSHMAYQNEPTLVIVAVLEENGEKIFFQWFPPGGKDKVLLPEDLPSSLAREADWVHLNGTVVQDGGESSQNVTAFVEEAAAAGAVISFDLNLRGEVYPLTEERRALLGRVLNVSDYIFGSGADEWCPLSGIDDLEKAAASYATPGNVVVCRDGPNPVVVFDHLRRSVYPLPKVKLVNRVGAGDMFDVGFLSCMLSGGTSGEAVLWGNAVASHAISQSTPRSVPDEKQLQALIEAQMELIK